MTHLVEIAFKGNRKEFFLWGEEQPPGMHAHVIVEADRGEDVGRVNAVGDLARLRARGCTHGIGEADPTQKALRFASPGEVRHLSELREQDDLARREAMEMVKSHALPMKLTDAEWRWDRRKLTMYFTADRRVDFRALVRDLAAKFRTRIELKQIGVRDEAKRLDGVGRCGRQYCSASWLPDLRPVNLGLAKDQKLSLNPTQISGACGRLMCCLRYEHDWYVETRRRFPKEGKVVSTALGEEKVVVNDLFRERITLRRMADGETRIIGLEQLNKELRGEPIETDAETDVVPLEEWNEELLAMTDTVERPIPALLRAPRPSERPVKIERAPARPPESPAEQAPERGAGRAKDRAKERPPRDRDRDRDRERKRPERASGRPGDAAAPSAAPQSAPATAPASEPGAAPISEAPQESRAGGRQRSRRRRGRRGGRRGDGGNQSGNQGGDANSGGATPPGAPS